MYLHLPPQIGLIQNLTTQHPRVDIALQLASHPCYLGSLHVVQVVVLCCTNRNQTIQANRQPNPSAQ